MLTLSLQPVSSDISFILDPPFPINAPTQSVCANTFNWNKIEEVLPQDDECIHMYLETSKNWKLSLHFPLIVKDNTRKISEKFSLIKVNFGPWRSWKFIPAKLGARES